MFELGLMSLHSKQNTRRSLEEMAASWFSGTTLLRREFTAHVAVDRRLMARRTHIRSRSLYGHATWKQCILLDRHERVENVIWSSLAVTPSTRTRIFAQSESVNAGGTCEASSTMCIDTKRISLSTISQAAPGGSRIHQSHMYTCVIPCPL